MKSGIGILGLPEVLKKSASACKVRKAAKIIIEK